MADDDLPYQVGYRKPPAAGQFRKGVSGNPGGRPKGSKNIATIALKESRQLVLVKGPRGVRKVSKIEAGLMQLGNKSAQGDVHALRQFITLLQWSESVIAGTLPHQTSEIDQRMMASIARRFRSLELSSDESSTKESE